MTAPSNSLEMMKRPLYPVLAGFLWTVLFVSGMVLWLPPVSAHLAAVGLKLVYLHVVAGLLLAGLLVAGMVGSLRGGAGAPALGRTFFFSERSQTLPSWVTAGIKTGLLLLLVSGLAMVPGGRMPGALLKWALFFHGAGILILLPLICAALVYAYSAKRRNRPEGAPVSWNPAVQAEKFRVTIAEGGAAGDESRAFVTAFGSMLKHSGLRHYMENYTPAGGGIFSFAKRANPQLRDCTTPGACLAFIFREYFTLRGWIAGWGSEKKLTPPDIAHLTDVFYGYHTCPPGDDIQSLAAGEALMAKYGRFLLAAAGIVPSGFQTASETQKAEPDSQKAGAVFRESLQALEEELRCAGYAGISLTAEREGADFLVIPAVHDFSGQADTLRGLIVLLSAARCDWTIGRSFFDGMNYGALFGAWHTTQVQERLIQEAGRLKAGRILLGGCTGFSFSGGSEKIVTANTWIEEQIKSERLTFSTGKYQSEKIGFAGYCDSGCHLDGQGKSLWITQRVFGPVLQVARPAAAKNGSGALLAGQLDRLGLTVIIAPYHNTRERLRAIVKRSGLAIRVAGLYEILAETAVRK